MDNIYLATLPYLSPDYQYVLDFANKGAQETYFKSKATKIMKAKFKIDAEMNEITLEAPISDLRPFDYLFFYDKTGRGYYYFITNKAYNTEYTTRISTELDVWSSYLFDFELSDSFVERCHVQRWTSTGRPTVEVVDEGLALGEYVVSIADKLIDHQPYYIMSSTTPLGTLDYASGPSGAEPDIPGSMNTEMNLLGAWAVPTYGSITATWPYYSGGGWHGGIDIANVRNTPVWAGRAGKVEYAGWQDPNNSKAGFGIYIRIRHDDESGTYYSYYAHLESVLVSVGQVVSAGQLIGRMGATGNVISSLPEGTPNRGVHLHFEIRVNTTAGGSTSNTISPLPRYNEVGSVIPQPKIDGLLPLNIEEIDETATDEEEENNGE